MLSSSLAKCLQKHLDGGAQGHARTGTSVRVTEMVIAEASVAGGRELEVVAGGLAVDLVA